MPEGLATACQLCRTARSPPFPLVSSASFGSARSRPGREAAERTLDGEDRSDTIKREGKGGFSKPSRRDNVRLPNGWGSWVPTMEAAVNRAISLSFKFRSQVTADEALQEMIEYVKEQDEDEPEKP